jgi:hypothetical protein
MRLLVVALFACGSPQAKHTEPVANKQPASTAGAPIEAECDRLLVHIVELEFDKYGMPEKVEERELPERQRREFRAECLKMPRVRLTCALAASTLEAVAKCDEV